MTTAELISRFAALSAAGRVREPTAIGHLIAEATVLSASIPSDRAALTEALVAAVELGARITQLDAKIDADEATLESLLHGASSALDAVELSSALMIPVWKFGLSDAFGLSEPTKQKAKQ